MANLNSCDICNLQNLDKDELAELKCKDKICWSCLKNYIKTNLAPKIPCPNCKNIFIDDVTLRKVLNEEEILEYEKKCFEFLNQPSYKLVKCLLGGCDYTIYVDDDLQFECGVCSMFNCTLCNDVHPFMNCEEYMRKCNSDKSADKREIKNMVDEEKARASRKLKAFKDKQQKQMDDELDKLDIMPNKTLFECSICTKIVAKGDGVMLRNCKHPFCKPCLQQSVYSSDKIPILCPENDCEAKLQDREIRAILTKEQLTHYENKSVVISVAKLSNSFHCKSPDCPYLVIVEDDDIMFFKCPMCKKQNCIKCKVIHKNGESCYRSRNPDKSSPTNHEEAASEQYIRLQLKNANCMECPSCGMIISKDGGCNWLRCPSCKLELCWILKMRRWGPKGPGDVSGGCRCGVNGELCSPNCYLGCMPEDD